METVEVKFECGKFLTHSDDELMIPVSKSALDSMQAMASKLQEERDMLLAALKEIIADRDSQSFKPEEFFHSSIGDYWSPHATMVRSEVISKGRTAIAKVEQG
jgi:hypothetical protein